MLEWPPRRSLAKPDGTIHRLRPDRLQQGRRHGLASEGVVYVPTDCARHPGCRLHIALHDCEQARETVGDTFIKESGFAR
jgi:hypothetical protein